MPKKNNRGNNTYLIEGHTGDNPKLMGQSLSDGRDSLYLEFYLGYDKVESRSGKVYNKIRRSTERLGLFVWQAPRTPLERQQNKETIGIAKRIRFERGQELLDSTEGYRLRKDRNVNLLGWMLSYHEAYTKADKRLIKQAYTVFVDYLIDPKDTFTPKPDWTKAQREEAAKTKAKKSKNLKVKPQQLTRSMVSDFAAYLQRRYSGEGPHSVFARFKKMIRAAEADGIISKNPCTGLTIKVDNGALKKDVLSMDEVSKLVATHYPGENADIRRAFIFCLYCGLRWCDVKDLVYADVDYSNRLLRFEQSKTRGRSSASSVVIPLNDSLLRLIGEPSDRAKREELIFPLPSHNMCLKALRHWTARAGIEKHITWHCARHSFAVNILNNGANIKTVASLLGHSSLKETEKYTRAIDSLKVAAINSLPELEL